MGRKLACLSGRHACQSSLFSGQVRSKSANIIQSGGCRVGGFSAIRYDLETQNFQKLLQEVSLHCTWRSVMGKEGPIDHHTVIFGSIPH